MKRAVFLLLYISFALHSAAQVRELFYNSHWQQPYRPAETLYYAQITKTDSGWYRRAWYAYDRSTLVWEGLFSDSLCQNKKGYHTRYYVNGQVESRFQYKNNLNDGLCLGWHPNGVMKDSGYYQAGRPTGITREWYTNGKLASGTIWMEGEGNTETWFDTGERSGKGITSLKQKVTGSFYWIKSGEWKFYRIGGSLSAVVQFKDDNILQKTFFDEKGDTVKPQNREGVGAMFADGESGWSRYVRSKVILPDGVKYTNLEYVIVEITFTIDRGGKVKDAYVSQSFHPLADKVALQVIQSSPAWEPAILYNRNVPVTRKYEVTFW